VILVVTTPFDDIHTAAVDGIGTADNGEIDAGALMPVTVTLFETRWR
jgi:hypothetical protein